MSHVWQLEAAALGQVALAAVVLGAGLPALFALGVRASAWGRDRTAGTGAAGRTGAGAAADAPPRPLGRVVSTAVYAVVVLVALAGILLIVASGFGMAVSFEHVVPVLVEK